MFKLLDSAVKEEYPIVIVAEGIEQEALAPVIRNKLRGVLKAAAIKAPAFGERKSHYLDDIATLTGGRWLSINMTNSLSFHEIVSAIKENTQKTRISRLNMLLGNYPKKKKRHARRHLFVIPALGEFLGQNHT